mgnify:CR=1 FL=1
MATIDIKVPDIGDFAEVAIIEVLVQPGDTIKAEQSLITVESDKASMEIPSSHAGVVKELRVKLGDKVAKGSVVLTLEVEGAGVAAPAAAPAPAPAAAPVTSEQKQAPALTAQAQAAINPVASSFAGSADLECDLLVLGGGPGGYSAAFRAADLGLMVVLVERYAQLGGVCLNVGCIPSKALLHVAAVMDEVSHLSAAGIDFGAPTVNVDTLRGHKEKVIGKLTGGLAQMAKMRKVTTVRGYGAFVGANHVEVEETTGSGQEKTGTKKVIAFQKAIIAAGSQAVRLPFMPDDPRVVDSTGALALQGVPQKMLIVGGGIIGLEMATVYTALGSKVTVVEFMDQLMPGADKDLVKPLADRLTARVHEQPVLHAAFVFAPPAGRLGRAFPGNDAGHHVVEKRPVVAHQKHRTVVALQQVFQQFKGVDVQVVGGLVEHQHIGRARKQPRQQQPVALAARKAAHG